MVASKKQKPNYSKVEKAAPQQFLDIPLSGMDKGTSNNSAEKIFARFEWEESFSATDVQHMIHLINTNERHIDDSKVELCRASKQQEYIYIDFYSSSGEILATHVINHDKLEELGSPRTGHTEPMDDENEKDAEKPLRPRWAEEARPKKQVKLRLKPSMISEVDSASKSSGKNRNDWIEDAIQKALDAGKPKPK